MSIELRDPQKRLAKRTGFFLRDVETPGQRRLTPGDYQRDFEPLQDYDGTLLCDEDGEILEG